MTPPKRIGPWAGADSKAYGKTWERPDNKPRRRQSPYRRRDGSESAIGCLIRRTLLKCGGTVRR